MDGTFSSYHYFLQLGFAKTCQLIPAKANSIVLLLPHKKVGNKNYFEISAKAYENTDVLKRNR